MCSQPTHGDRDVVEAHVDACLAYESRRAQVERERERMVRLVRGNEGADVDVDGNTGWDVAEEGSVRTRVITNASLRGTGIHIRPSTMDTEDVIDIDGTDDAVFGDAQFGEADVLRVELEADVDTDGAETVGQRSNHNRQTQDTTPTYGGPLSRPQGVDEDMDKLDLAILTARSRGDNLTLIAALEAKLNAIVCLLPLVSPILLTFLLVSLRKRLVASVCRHMSTPRYQQGVGTRAVQYVGLDVLVQRNSAQCASGLRGHLN